MDGRTDGTTEGRKEGRKEGREEGRKESCFLYSKKTKFCVDAKSKSFISKDDLILMFGKLRRR